MQGSTVLQKTVHGKMPIMLLLDGSEVAGTKGGIHLPTTTSTRLRVLCTRSPGEWWNAKKVLTGSPSRKL